MQEFGRHLDDSNLPTPQAIPKFLWLSGFVPISLVLLSFAYYPSFPIQRPTKPIKPIDGPFLMSDAHVLDVSTSDESLFIAGNCLPFKKRPHDTLLVCLNTAPLETLHFWSSSIRG
jgi:hypothetical protein